MFNYHFDNISLIPRIVSTVESRDDIQIQIPFGPIKLTTPIISSPMKDVCNGKVAQKLNELGGFGFIHRFSSIEQQIKEFQLLTDSKSGGCAIGINGDYYERFQALCNNQCRIFCIDVANGASIQVKQVIEKLTKYNCNTDFIVGNIGSVECLSYIQDIPHILGVRVGISGGSGCSTKDATGIYSSTLSAICECNKLPNRKILLIADGGIKYPSDMCKSLACGADLVMLGGMIASTKDSPAKLIRRDNQLYKVFNGSASFNIQKHYKNKPKYIEGLTRLISYTGETLKSLIERFNDGLRSSMSYFNSRTLKEYRQNISWKINL